MRINTSANSSASVMARGQGDASMARCMETSWIARDMIKVLAELQDSGGIYFQSRYPNCKFDSDVQLALPLCFIEEHGNKFEEYVILRTQSSAKPWVVEVIVFEAPHAKAQVRFASGWEEFAAHNRLKRGDSLIFVLKVPLSEFEVYIFRRSKVYPSSERKDSASQHGTNPLPNFQKRITATNIRRGRIEVPSRFLEAHLRQLMKPRADHVEVQGIRQESPVHTLACYWFEQGEIQRLYFDAGWRRFLEENDLHEGEELRFTLTSASFFVVRKV